MMLAIERFNYCEVWFILLLMNRELLVVSAF